jgi:hypothetical protein
MSLAMLMVRRHEKLTRMLVLKFRQVIDILVDDDPQIVALVMRCDIALGKGFGHDRRNVTAGMDRLRWSGNGW